MLNNFKFVRLLAFAIIVVIAAGIHVHNSSTKDNSSGFNEPTASKVETVNPNMCAQNVEAQALVVSVSKRHVWACSSTKSVYDTAVVTGMEKIAADLTPRGTYKIYAKETNRYLAGSDSTGSWNDYVYYWMPFLDNQYGTYGFHDATWRSDSAFGKIDPNSSQASHGCVEMTKTASAWLYNWTPVGTTVQVIN